MGTLPPDVYPDESHTNEGNPTMASRHAIAVRNTEQYEQINERIARIEKIVTGGTEAQAEALRFKAAEAAKEAQAANEAAAKATQEKAELQSKLELVTEASKSMADELNRLKTEAQARADAASKSQTDEINRRKAEAQGKK